MANTAVEVQRTAPALTEDSWPAFRGEMERLFDRFGFGMKPVRDWFELESVFRTPTGFELLLSRTLLRAIFRCRRLRDG
jgi:hypothetical protein